MLVSENIQHIIKLLIKIAFWFDILNRVVVYSIDRVAQGLAYQNNLHTKGIHQLAGKLV